MVCRWSETDERLIWACEREVAPTEAGKSKGTSGDLTAALTSG